MKKVAVIMGSDSDWPVVKAAVEQLKDFSIPYEAHILSAHRTPVEAAAYPPGKTTLASSSAPPAWPHTWPALLPPIPPCLSLVSP